MNKRLKKFISYYRPYKTLFLADMTCAFFAAGITLIIPLCVRYMTKNILLTEHMLLMGLLMLCLIGLHTLCDMFISYQGHMMGAKMERDMRVELFHHYQKLSFSFYDGQKTGQLMTRMTNDLLSLTELFHHGPEDIAISFVKIIGSFIILSLINIKMSLSLLLFVPLMFFYAVYFNKKMNKAMRISKDRVGDINERVEDSLAGIRVVKSFGNEEEEMRKFSFENNRFLESRRASYKSQTFFHEGLFFFMQLMSLLVVVLGAFLIKRSQLDLADLVTYLLFVGILIEPIQRLVYFIPLYQEGITAFDRFMEILDVPIEIKDKPFSKDLNRANGELEFKGVGFSYERGETQNPVLKDLSFKIRAGEFVAIVGPSGVGKTTICSLIPRFYELDKGEILFDGINIRDLSLKSLREQIGIVQQDIYLFGGTVLENIRYGKLNATKAEIIAAAKKANAHDFIMRLPHAYETDIGQRGVKLSGGQKQRLSIARVFLKNPPFIIFDEATSALDNESEKAVQKALEELSHSRTSLVIAHRLSTVKNADRILVLSDEGILEEGNHFELMKKGGRYKDIYCLQ